MNDYDNAKEALWDLAQTKTGKLLITVFFLPIITLAGWLGIESADVKQQAQTVHNAYYAQQAALQHKVIDTVETLTPDNAPTVYEDIKALLKQNRIRADALFLSFVDHAEKYLTDAQMQQILDKVEDDKAVWEKEIRKAEQPIK